MTIGQFPFITEKISEQALIKTALVLLPRPLQTFPGTLGPGLVIQQGDRMCMFRAWRPVGNSSGSFAIYSTQSMRLVTHEQQSIAVEVINRGVF